MFLYYLTSRLRLSDLKFQISNALRATSDNSHYSIIKELKLLSTKRRNFNSQSRWIKNSTYDSLFSIGNRKCPGGGEGIRTPDPRVANAVLCQLSYAPILKLVAGAGFEPATFGL